MRTLGNPSSSTVASAMALGSLGSEASASFSHSPNRLKGSFLSVKPAEAVSLEMSLNAMCKS